MHSLNIHGLVTQTANHLASIASNLVLKPGKVQSLLCLEKAAARKLLLLEELHDLIRAVARSSCAPSKGKGPDCCYQ